MYIGFKAQTFIQITPFTTVASLLRHSLHETQGSPVFPVDDCHEDDGRYTSVDEAC